MLLNSIKKWIVIIVTAGCMSAAWAKRFDLPSPGNDMIGEIRYAVVQKGDNFGSLAQKYDIGYYELIEANPDMDPEHPRVGATIVLPERHILPNVPRVGIVVNLAEMRLYYFPKGQSEVWTYPAGIGQMGWMTPLGHYQVLDKMAEPTWYVPDSIRDFRASQGVLLPKVVKPGPDNPLGHFAMRLSWTTYLIHGTNDPTGIGRRSTSGCMRLYPWDIEQLFGMVPKGTPIQIINDPYKIGWNNNKLYLEVHVPLQEDTKNSLIQDFTPLTKQVAELTAHKPARIDWKQAFELARAQEGIPQVIGNLETGS